MWEKIPRNQLLYVQADQFCTLQQHRVREKDVQEC